MRSEPIHIFMATCAICSLAACGGGGGLASIPPPAVSPTPLPPPPPPPPRASAPFGLTTDTKFATIGDEVEFRWSAAAGAYELGVSGGPVERLTLGDSSATAENHYPPSSHFGLTLRKDLDLRHTNLGVIFENGWGGPIGLFAYGIPTAAGDVPLSGSASYAAQVKGRAGQGNEAWVYNVSGSASLSFDFGAGTLRGQFDPRIDNWTDDFRELGRYDFVNTVFGVGSTSFSGGLRHGSFSQLGSFSGLFTGPQTAELMARWNAPYVNPWTSEQGTITGVWVGKKGN